MSRYAFRETEAKWQRVWDERGCFRADDRPGAAEILRAGDVPLPVGAHPHGPRAQLHAWATCVARYKRAHGFNVLHPMGWDAFGLPAENAAIARRASIPATWTYDNIAEMRGAAEDAWACRSTGRARSRPATRTTTATSRRCSSTSSRRGLVYRKESWVNWDPVDQTVLANEQVIDGRGWRSGALVERRKLAQWFFKHHRTTPTSCWTRLDAGALAGQGPADAGATGSAGPRARASRFPVDGRERRARGLHHPARHPVRRQLPGARRRTIRWRPSWRAATRRWPPSSPSASASAPARRRSRRPRSTATTPACAPPPVRRRAGRCRSRSPISC